MQNIDEIVNEKILKKESENETLDYKVKYYDDKNEVIKDIISFLNSVNSYKEDKYLIFGVNDKKELIGLKKEFVDNSNLVSLCQTYIDPEIKSINSGNFKIEEKNVGWIQISGLNVDIPYVLKKELNLKNKSKSKTFSKGCFWYRKNTKTLPYSREVWNTLWNLSNKTSGQEYRLNLIENKTNLQEKELTIFKKEGSISFDPRKNNGVFAFIFESKEFFCKFQIPSNNLIRIYNASHVRGTNIVKVGSNLENNEIDFETLTWKNWQKFNFSSSVIELRENEVAILINKKGEAMKIQLNAAFSFDHNREKKHYFSINYKII